MGKESLFEFIIAGKTDIERVMASESLKVDNIKIDPNDEENVIGILGRGSGSTYVPQLNIFTGEFQCTCQDFLNRLKMCKHLCALVNYLYANNSRLYKRFVEACLMNKKTEVTPPVSYYSTGVKELDELLCGGIPKGKIFGVIGETKIGKTWFCMQVATKIASLGEKVLYFDNEQVFISKDDDATKRFFEYMSKRWNVPKEKFYENIDFIAPTSLEQFYSYFGLNARIELEGDKSDSKKFTTIVEDLGTESIAEIALRDKNYSVLIIDSITSPLKDRIPISNQNFPARANLINQLYGKLRDLSKKYSKTIIVVHHLTRNEMNKERDPKGQGMWGGYTVKFNTQYAIQIYRHPKYDPLNIRKVIRLHYPGLLPAEISLVMKDDWGLTSLTPT